MTLCIGDKVVLENGGPPMTVTRVFGGDGKELVRGGFGFYRDQYEAESFWCDRNNVPHEKRFLVTLLKSHGRE